MDCHVAALLAMTSRIVITYIPVRHCERSEAIHFMVKYRYAKKIVSQVRDDSALFITPSSPFFFSGYSGTGIHPRKRHAGFSSGRFYRCPGSYRIQLPGRFFFANPEHKRLFQAFYPPGSGCKSKHSLCRGSV